MHMYRKFLTPKHYMFRITEMRVKKSLLKLSLLSSGKTKK